MSLTARSKSEVKKVSISKPSSAKAGAGVPTSGYNPLLQTFHSLDTAPWTSNASVHVNDRFKNINETDDLSGHSYGAGGEYETVSNNGSLSGESDEHKEKTSNLPLRQESFSAADNDKREKNRQKNEKKHQRQKERRAQELHEKCNGYLMSRKLEALAEQLVSMGFSSEQATMALILNEGKVEESVAWLFEGGEEAYEYEEQGLDTGDNLKIDISEEFARIADLENRFNCSKQDVERAVVACEGDLGKAEDVLRSQKQEVPPSVLLKPEKTSAPPTMCNDKLHPTMGNDKLHPSAGKDKLPIGAAQNLPRVLVKPSSSSTIPAKRDDKVFGYTKVVPAGPSMDPGSKNIPLLKRDQPELDWGKSNQVSVPVDKKCLNSGENPSISFSLSSSVEVSVPAPKTETRYVAVENELKNLQIETVKEPVTVMQRTPSVNARHTPTSNVSSSLPGTVVPFLSNNIVGTMTPNGMIPHIPVTRSLSMNGFSTNQLFNQLHHQQHQQPEQLVSSCGTHESPGTSWGNSLWSRTVGALQTQPTAAATSPGLFSNLGTNSTYGLLSPVDWSTGSRPVMQVDYKKIDWSLHGSLPSSGVDWSLHGGSSSSGADWSLHSGLSSPGVDWSLHGGSSSSGVDWSLDGGSSSSGIEWCVDRGSVWSGTGDTWPTNQPTTDSLMQHYNPDYEAFYRGPEKSTARPVLSNEIDVCIPGLQNGVSTAETAAAGASGVWTSPFEERDLFSLPRQFISPPSL
ncbi:hypothetical protein BC332_32195 [Capsicum chinense]|nr:hypothetical protein BC332_32195 [Capsicum chinense]